LTPESQIRRFYTTLYRAWGRQHWWPARTRFEVIVGAILTQNTAWTNVARALRRLRQARVLALEGIRRTPEPELAELIRSSGYFRQKARRLKNFVEFLDARYRGSLDRMVARPTAELRRELLALNGIGPETADSILLYAGNHPVFVVDAYTRRLVERHGILPPTAKYDEIRELFERSLIATKTSLATGDRRLATGPEGSCHSPSPMSCARREPLVQAYNEMHGLIVGVGKNFCLKQNPLCKQCPLGKFLLAPPLISKQRVSS
jgi:endonuclease-3 related protein